MLERIAWSHLTHCVPSHAQGYTRSDASVKPPNNSVTLMKRGELVEDYQAIATRNGRRKGWTPNLFVPSRSSGLLRAIGAGQYCDPGPRSAPSDIWRQSPVVGQKILKAQKGLASNL